MSIFQFDFDRHYRLVGVPFGVTPARTRVEVDEKADGRLRVRFGFWRLETDLRNITGVQLTEDYAFIKTAGPPHLSFSDRGITFATNGRRGACVSFATPVPGIDPTGRITHPGATMTLADPDVFRTELLAMLGRTA